MNADPAHRRVWLRREVIPALEIGAARDLRSVLARQADVARADSDLLDGMAGDLLAGVARGEALDAHLLAAAPLPLARRALRRWLGPPPPSAGEIDRVMAVARGERKAVEVAGGVEIRRSGGRIHRRVDSSTDPSAADVQTIPVDLPGRATGFGVELVSWVERAAPVRWPDGRWTAVVDADLAGGRAVLRPAGPGERFVPLGLTGHKAVTTALAEAGVPPAVRARHPILAGTGTDLDGSPLWVLGYRIDHRVRVSAGTRRFLWLTVEAGGP
jgi:tRNA(Ile)-lysidine synthase